MNGEPEIKILELKEGFIRFEIRNISSGAANALRRTLINDIPKLAIDKVIFRHGQIRTSDGNVFDSSLPLFDEMVAHRIGLIPIKTDLKMNFREKCSCGGKGCSLCTVSYNINKTGPGLVTSADLLPFTGNVDLVPTDMNIPIVKLGPKQALLVTAEAYMGTASTHIKWQVTSAVAYKYHREYDIPKDDNPEWKNIKEKYKGSVVAETDEILTVTDDFPKREVMTFINTALRRAVVDKRPIVTREDQNRFIFHFETDGSLTARDVLQYAIKRLPVRLEELYESMVTPD
ncbi:DNA-directed RNA polymerase subunit D [Cuniculiplasma sp. SKW4]|uniref:DNA-directed RNA polymerase subunit D n=1 Tax=Cuniculiplasma sp. SKW4 TaxID=3400171 RepID=UPI003FD45035